MASESPEAAQHRDDRLVILVDTRSVAADQSFQLPATISDDER